MPARTIFYQLHKPLMGIVAVILVASPHVPEGSAVAAEPTSELPLEASRAPGKPSVYLPLIETHLRQLTTSGLDVYGPRHTGMWMAVIDTRTGRHPECKHTPRRVYRLIGAPRGSSLFRTLES